MRSREEIITEVANSTEIMQICRKITKGDPLHSDLFQEMILALMGQDPDRIEEMDDKGQLKWYVIGTLSRMWNSPRSNFYRDHRKFSATTNGISPQTVEGRHEYDTYSEAFLRPFLNIYTDEYDYDREALLCRLEDYFEEELMDEQTWYEAMLMRHTIQMGSQRKVAAATEIPYKSVQYSVRKFKARMRERMEGDDD